MLAAKPYLLHVSLFPCFSIYFLCEIRLIRQKCCIFAQKLQKQDE